MRKFLIFLSLFAIVAVGCGTAETTSEGVKQKESTIDKANKEGMEKNPPPPGEGPGN